MIGPDDGIDMGDGASPRWLSVRDLAERTATAMRIAVDAEQAVKRAWPTIDGLREVARGAEHAVGILATQVDEQLRGVTVAHGHALGEVREGIAWLRGVVLGHGQRLDAQSSTIRELVNRTSATEAQLDGVSRSCDDLAGTVEQERRRLDLHSNDLARHIAQLEATVAVQRQTIDALVERVITLERRGDR